MTHAETELERLKIAVKSFIDTNAAKLIKRLPDGAFDYAECAGYSNGMTDAANMLWPFVAYALSDMQGSAEKTAMLNRFKHALGMELMAHEHFFGDEK